jgi:hypothetical protein
MSRYGHKKKSDTGQKKTYSTTDNFFGAHRFILDRTFVDFMVSLLILPFDIVDFNSKMVKSTVKP